VPARNGQDVLEFTVAMSATQDQMTTPELDTLDILFQRAWSERESTAGTWTERQAPAGAWSEEG